MNTPKIIDKLKRILGINECSVKVLNFDQLLPIPLLIESNVKSPAASIMGLYQITEYPGGHNNFVGQTPVSYVATTFQKYPLTNLSGAPNPPIETVFIHQSGYFKVLIANDTGDCTVYSAKNGGTICVPPGSWFSVVFYRPSKLLLMHSNKSDAAVLREGLCLKLQYEPQQ